jgi:hypothetical protein
VTTIRRPAMLAYTDAAGASKTIAMRPPRRMACTPSASPAGTANAASGFGVTSWASTS